LGANPTLAPYAKSDGIHLRITAKASNRLEATALIEPLEAQVRQRLGGLIYGMDDETPSSVVSRLLYESHFRFVVLEIGEGAIGSVAQSLGSHPLCHCVLSGRDLAVVAEALGVERVGSTGDIDTICREALSKFGADLCLGVLVEQQVQRRSAPGIQDSEDKGAVQFSAVIVTLESGAARQANHSSQSWRTARSEVARLVGLAALNHLRGTLTELTKSEELSARA